MELRWIDHDRECVARFRTADEARACAEGFGLRDGVENIQLFDGDGEPLPSPTRKQETES